MFKPQKLFVCFLTLFVITIISGCSLKNNYDTSETSFTGVNPPGVGRAGRTIMIYGTNLPPSNIYINGTSLEIVSQTSEIIIVKLPIKNVQGELTYETSDGDTGTIADNYAIDVRPFDLFEAQNYELSKANAYLLATASFLIYKDGTEFENKMNEWGMVNSYFFSYPGTATQVGLAMNKDIIIVSFRGTESSDIDIDWSDVNSFLASLTSLIDNDFGTDAGTNLMKAPAAWGTASIPATPATGGIASDNNLRVHQGAYMAVNSVWDDIEPLINTHVSQGKKLWITGHSLGGALATIMAYRCNREGIQVKGVYTFGSFMTGDEYWAYRYNDELGTKTWRYLMSGDPVPTFPPVGYPWDCDTDGKNCFPSVVNPIFFPIPYKHVGSDYYLYPQWDGTISKFNYAVSDHYDGGIPWFHGAFLNHMMYQDALFKVYYDYLEGEGREDLMLILPPRQMKPANEEWVPINEE